MDSKSDWNDIEIKIRDEFQQIYDEHIWGINDNKPKPHLSFMNRACLPAFQWKKFSKVALLILSLMIFSSGMAIWINSDQAVASKFKLDQILYEMKSNTDNRTSTQDDRISFETSSLNDIQDAKKFYPALYVPSTIPEGYKLKKLQIDKMADAEYFTDYTFTNKYDKVIDIIINSSTTPGTVEIAAETTLIKFNNSDLYIWRDPTSQRLRGVCLLDTHTLLSISGPFDQATMIEMISSFEK